MSCLYNTSNLIYLLSFAAKESNKENIYELHSFHFSLPDTVTAPAASLTVIYPSPLQFALSSSLLPKVSIEYLIRNYFPVQNEEALTAAALVMVFLALKFKFPCCAIRFKEQKSKIKAYKTFIVEIFLF